MKKMSKGLIAITLMIVMVFAMAVTVLAASPAVSFENGDPYKKVTDPAKGGKDPHRDLDAQPKTGDGVGFSLPVSFENGDPYKKVTDPAKGGQDPHRDMQPKTGDASWYSDSSMLVTWILASVILTGLAVVYIVAHKRVKVESK